MASYIINFILGVNFIQMSKDEFFAFMPLLIYGIAVSELIMHWRDYLKSDRRYWAHLLTGIILLELAFVNFYYLYDELNELFVDYLHFLFRLIGPLILLLTVSVYTPEDNKDIKEYFFDKSPIIFTLLGSFILVNLLSEFKDPLMISIRLVAIVLCVLLATTRKFWILWFWVALRLALFFVE